MQLREVSYLLFEHELGGCWSNQTPKHHQLDGEVLLTFEDAPPIYVSWGKSQATYCIEKRPASFFREGLLTRHEMSQHQYWSSLIGKNIQLSHIDELHQVLVASCGDIKLYLSSQYDGGEFMGDCVRVSLIAPESP